MVLPAGYRLRAGSALERALLLKFMQRTYAERCPGGSFSHLAQTVDHYLCRETPLWWVDVVNGDAEAMDCDRLLGQKNAPIACLWLGTAIDQLVGDRHTHVFLLYVEPPHRRQGIGIALMQHAEAWARARGDRQIGLQVFESNQAALNLYRSFGFQTQSFWMVKSLEQDG